MIKEKQPWHKEGVKEQDYIAQFNRWADRAEFQMGCAYSVPAKYKGASLDTLDAKGDLQAKAAYDAIRDYHANLERMIEKGHCLLLRGNVGTGKSHSLAAIIHRCYGLMVHCMYVPAYTLDENRVDSGYRRSLAATELLALDDLLATNKVQVAHAFEIIDRRYSEGKPTMLATNDVNTIDPRIIDRLVENGTDILMDWPSHRST